MIQMSVFILMCLPTSPPASPAAPDSIRVRALTLDGREIVGVVREWRLDGDLQIETPAGKTEHVPSAEIDRIEAGIRSNSTPTGTWVVEAAGGIRLICEIVGGDDRSITLNHAQLETFDLPLERLVRISRKARDARLRRPRDDSADIAVLANGDVVKGVMARVTAKSVVFSDGDGQREIRLNVLDEVILADTIESKSSGLRAAIELKDGAELTAERLNWSGDSVAVTVSGGTQILIQQDDLSRIEIVGGRRAWLGAIKPAAYEYTPYFGRSWHYRVDANATGGPLVLHGRTYRRGIGLHSACRISWDLAGRFVRFSAKAGIDDSGGRYADADLIVRVDGGEVCRLDGLRTGAEPRAIDVPVENAKRLTIEVEFGKRGDVQDRVDVVNAALFRR